MQMLVFLWAAHAQKADLKAYAAQELVIISQQSALLVSAKHSLVFLWAAPVRKADREAHAAQELVII